MAVSHALQLHVTAARNTAFRIPKGRKLKTRRTVLWWNDELKILRKKSKSITTAISTNFKQ